MLDVSITEDNLMRGYSAIVTYEKIEKETKPPFRMIGRDGIYKGAEAMNLIQVLLSVPKQGQWLFQQLEASMDFKTNIAILIASELDEAERRKLITGYKQLRDADLIRRVKKQTYMINPTAIIPNVGWRDSLNLYNTLK